jgi:hypothetical protein
MKLGDNIKHIQSLKMIVARKVDELIFSVDENHTTSALEQPIEV